MLKVSVIIPTLNEAEGIEQAIHHAWLTGPHEVIVVDGGSNDATVEVARCSASAVFSAPKGRAFQQNLGAQHASGDVFLFLHADNRLAPHGVQQMLRALENPKVQVGAFCQHIQATGRIYRLLEQGNAYRVFRWGLAYGDQGLFIRRELFETQGGFPKVPLMEDYFFLKQLRKQHWPVLLPGPLFISPRRWKRHGVLKQTSLNWMLITATQWGISPEYLTRFYRPHQSS